MLNDIEPRNVANDDGVRRFVKQRYASGAVNTSETTYSVKGEFIAPTREHDAQPMQPNGAVFRNCQLPGTQVPHDLDLERVSSRPSLSDTRLVHGVPSYGNTLDTGHVPADDTTYQPPSLSRTQSDASRMNDPLPRRHHIVPSMTGPPVSATPTRKRKTRGPRKASPENKSDGPIPKGKPRENSARNRGKRSTSDGRATQGARRSSKAKDVEPLEDDRTHDLTADRPLRALVPYGVSGRESEGWIPFEDSKETVGLRGGRRRGTASEARHSHSGTTDEFGEGGAGPSGLRALVISQTHETDHNDTRGPSA